MDEFELELKHDFLAESEDLLNQAEEVFLRLEENSNDPQLLNEIFRLAHNLKGTSKAVGFDQLAEVTHIAENLILKLKEGEMEPTAVVVSGLLAFNDKVVEMVDTLKDDLDAQFDITGICTQLQEITDGGTAAREELKPVPKQTIIQESALLDEDSEYFEEEIAMPPSSVDESNWAQEDEPAKKPAVVEPVVESEVSAAAIESLLACGSTEEEIKELLGLDVLPTVVASAPIEEEPKLEVSAAAIESLLACGSTEEEVKELLGLDVLPTFEVSAPIEKEIAPIAEVAPVPVKLAPVIPEVVAEEKAKAKKPEQKEDESIRVKLGRINHLTDIVGELVILQTVLSQRRFEYIEDDLANQSIGMMSKLFKEVQELTMSLRMLPLKTTFQKMNRIVRDTSNALDKKVQLSLIGEETEVDKTVLEHLSDPLVHMVRNAVDHGLETNAERIAAGKSEFGQVEIMAFHEGSNLVIQVTDDGKGIDPEIIREKAIRKNVIRESETLSPQEILQLVFHPGFSTKEEVTEVSGRGVGMDVVKNNIEQLGGEVKLMSKIGSGSSFKVILPLTLAIIDGLVITVAKEKFVIPLGQVHELVLIPRKEIEVFSGAAELCRVRGEVYPLFFLNAKLGGKRMERDSETVIIVRGQGQSYGISVDNIVNQQQIVIKKLGDDIRGKKGIMGSAIMGDGRPSFILDVHELFKDDFKKSRGYEKIKQQVKNAA
jgi:two-component system chemotaxis sensor kinase CheA